MAAHVTLQRRAALRSRNFQLSQGNFPGLPRPKIYFVRIVLAVGDGNNMAAVPFYAAFLFVASGFGSNLPFLQCVGIIKGAAMCVQ